MDMEDSSLKRLSRPLCISTATHQLTPYTPLAVRIYSISFLLFINLTSLPDYTIITLTTSAASLSLEEMEDKKVSPRTSLFRAFAVILLSHQLLVPVMSVRFTDNKTYYSPDPTPRTPPSGSPPSHGTTPSPPHGSYTPTPSHGGGGSTPPPSHGGGSYTPTPTPSTPTPTPPSHGGGSYTPTPTPTPSTPSDPRCHCGSPPHRPSPSTPSNPPSNPPSGGYYTSPPPSGGGGSTTPTPVVVTPPTPISGSPPTSPVIDPGSPGAPFYPAPLPPITGTCDYWRTHPTLIFGLLGWWGTVGGALGAGSVPGFSPNMNLLQALSNTHTNGYGALYREGTASWLNSMVNNKFPFTTTQVRDNFVVALHSNKAAKAQARVFKLANEGHFKPRS